MKKILNKWPCSHLAIASKTDKWITPKSFCFECTESRKLKHYPLQPSKEEKSWEKELDEYVEGSENEIKPSKEEPESKEEVLLKGKTGKDYFIPEIVKKGNFIVARKPESKEDWEDRFDELFYEGDRNSVYCRKHNFFATPFEIKSLIRSEKKKSLDEINTLISQNIDLIVESSRLKMELSQAKEEMKKDIEEWRVNFAFLFPYQVERSKEWFEGYDYCKKGVKKELENLIDFINKK